MSLRVDGRVSSDSEHLSRTGIRRLPGMQRQLKHYVDGELFTEQFILSKSDVCFLPSSQNILNCMYETSLQLTFYALCSFSVCQSCHCHCSKYRHILQRIIIQKLLKIFGKFSGNISEKFLTTYTCVQWLQVIMLFFILQSLSNAFVRHCFTVVITCFAGEMYISYIVDD